ncbi:GntR family transcriptional regulator [Variovorax beijingensis]|uniref:GntR family transcriptional regulator n=2 Tax=Variovorax TaxID=34072 RepID=A0AAE3Y435_VARPD|nr:MULTISPECIES: GntR family transcriptional regulator [Variovorax]MDP9968685.1 GntR family transcriptional regulator [Variovorax paradoxus]MDR6430195.1 GntR family transcriptional regulator [Variovorax paradoxus]MDR6456844.1 GntR family transcriptional regulator [Variovorax paradoxus]TWD73509.1 GntR family transcriptional regulator [Variovorax beijingensis]
MNTSTAIASPLNGARGTALHRQVFLVLRDEISRGLFPDGLLPNEEALCERFGVSRITVRRALADLAALGVVERRHGRGTFVLGPPAQARPAPSLSVIDSLRQTATETVVQVLQVEQAVPPRDVGLLLQLPAGEKATHALRLRINRKGEPAMLTEAWVPAHLGRRVTEAALKKKALYEILMAQGVQFGRVVQEISATVGDPKRAGLLRTEVGAPILKLVRLMHDMDERPVQHLTAYMAADRASVLMEIAGASVNTLTAGQIVLDGPA